MVALGDRDDADTLAQVAEAGGAPLLVFPGGAPSEAEARRFPSWISAAGESLAVTLQLDASAGRVRWLGAEPTWGSTGGAMGNVVSVDRHDGWQRTPASAALPRGEVAFEVAISEGPQTFSSSAACTRHREVAKADPEIVAVVVATRLAEVLSTGPAGARAARRPLRDALARLRGHELFSSQTPSPYLATLDELDELIEAAARLVRG